MTIPEGPGGRKVIPHFIDEPEKQRSPLNRFGLRSIFVAILSVATGFLAMAFLIRPAIDHYQIAKKDVPEKTVSSANNGPSSNAAVSAGQPQPGSTVVYNGVTVLTPPLLVPAVSPNGAAIAGESPALSDGSTKNAKNRIARAKANRRAPGSNLPQWVSRF